jgi:hypothetical protein
LLERDLLLKLLSRTIPAVVFVSEHGIASLAQHDDSSAKAAVSWLIGRGILELFEIVLICSIVDVHLCLKILPASRAILPVTWMSLIMVIATKRVPAMVPVAAVPGVRKYLVLILIVANPLATTVCSDEVLRLPTEPAMWTIFTRF